MSTRPSSSTPGRAGLVTRAASPGRISVASALLALGLQLGDLRAGHREERLALPHPLAQLHEYLRHASAHRDPDLRRPGLVDADAGGLRVGPALAGRLGRGEPEEAPLRR